MRLWSPAAKIRVWTSSWTYRTLWIAIALSLLLALSHEVMVWIVFSCFFRDAIRPRTSCQTSILAHGSSRWPMFGHHHAVHRSTLPYIRLRRKSSLITCRRLYLLTPGSKCAQL